MPLRYRPSDNALLYANSTGNPLMANCCCRNQITCNGCQDEEGSIPGKIYADISGLTGCYAPMNGTFELLHISLINYPTYDSAFYRNMCIWIGGESNPGGTDFNIQVNYNGYFTASWGGQIAFGDHGSPTTSGDIFVQDSDIACNPTGYYDYYTSSCTGPGCAGSDATNISFFVRY